MQYPEDDDAIGFDAVEDRVRKLRNDGAPHIPMDFCEHPGIAFDGIEGRVDGAKKPFTELFDLLFVVCEGI